MDGGAQRLVQGLLRGVLDVAPDLRGCVTVGAQLGQGGADAAKPCFQDGPDNQWEPTVVTAAGGGNGLI